MSLLMTEEYAQTSPYFISTPPGTGIYGGDYTYIISTDDAEDNPHRLFFTRGSLSDGLSLAASGDGTVFISGILREPGNFSFEITVRENLFIIYTDVQSIDLDIARAALTVTTEDRTKVYGEVSPELTVSYSGFRNDDDILNTGTFVDQTLQSRYNSETGILDITGKKPPGTYDEILQSIQFRSPLTKQNELSDRHLIRRVSHNLQMSDPLLETIRVAGSRQDPDIFNALTTNGGGVNDSWNFLNLEYYKQVNISVYSQSGQPVFHCDQSGCTWDGNYYKVLPAGPNIYTIDLNAGQRTYKGTVTIF